MESIIHADIFFFVSTVALIVICIGLIIIIAYVIRILRDVSHVSSRVKEESEELINDIRSLRGNIKSEGFKFRYIKGFFGSIFNRRKTSRKSKSREDGD